MVQAQTWQRWQTWRLSGSGRARLWGVVSVLVSVMAAPPLLVAQKRGLWKAPARARRVKSPVVPTAGSITRGKLVFKQMCVVCHGTGGQGDGPAAPGLTPKPRNLTLPEIGAKKPGELFWKIKTGRAPMPSFGATLKAKQIWDLVNFVKSLSGQATRPTAGSERSGKTVPGKPVRARVSNQTGKHSPAPPRQRTPAGRHPSSKTNGLEL